MREPVTATRSSSVVPEEDCCALARAGSSAAAMPAASRLNARPDL